jgi:hypothetical protein
MAELDTQNSRPASNDTLETFLVHNGRIIAGTPLTSEQSRSILKLNPVERKKLYIRRSFAEQPEVERQIMDVIWRSPSGRWRMDVMAELIQAQGIKPEEQSIRKAEADFDRRIKLLETMGYLTRESRRNPRTRRDAIFLVPL